MERKELFRALVGSHNYGLNIKTSDKDFKVFSAPSFDDLYKGIFYSHDTISETIDLSYQDIRKLAKLLYKANVNWLEILFSKEIEFNTNLSQKGLELVISIFNMKNELVIMNLPYLFDACIGMHIEKVKKLHHYSDSCKYMEELYGYNVKEALHAYRILNLLGRFADNNFTDFGKIMYYEGKDKDYMMKIRNGEISEDVMVKTLKGYKEYIENKYKEVYHSNKPNEETKTKLDNIIYELVKLHIVEEA